MGGNTVTSAPGENENQQSPEAALDASTSASQETVNSPAESADVAAQSAESPELKAEREATELAKKQADAASLAARAKLAGDVESSHAEAQTDQQIATGDTPPSNPETADSSTTENTNESTNKGKAETAKDNTDKGATNQNVKENTENHPDKNASLFSKNRWGAVALDMARGMVIQAKNPDPSFFDKLAVKLKYYGLMLITAFTGKFWFDSLSPEAKAIMEEKFGMKGTEDGTFFEWGKGSENMDNFVAQLDVQSMLKVHLNGKLFDDFNAFENGSLVRADMTVKEFKDASSKITDPILKKKCEDIIASLPAEPAAKDDDKFYEFLGANSKEINNNLGISAKVERMKKNDEALYGIKDSAKDLSVQDSSFEYTKFEFKDAEEKELVEGPKIAIRKDSVTVGDKIYKISAPPSAFIQSLQSKESSDDHALGIEATISVNGATHLVENFLAVTPDGTNGMQIKINENMNLVLTEEAASPATPAPAEEPADESEKQEEKDIQSKYTEALSKLSQLENGFIRDLSQDTSVHFFEHFPYLESDELKELEGKVSISAKFVEIGGKRYQIELPEDMSIKDITFPPKSEAKPDISLNILDEKHDKMLHLGDLLTIMEELRTASGDKIYPLGDQNIIFKLQS